MKNFFLSKILLIFVLVINFHFCFPLKIICDSHKTIKVKPYETVFFESPNFPNLLNSEEMKNCSLRFDNVEVKDDVTMTLVLTNGYFYDGIVTFEDLKQNSQINYFQNEKIIDGRQQYFDNKTLSLFFLNKSAQSKNAFQGYLTFREFNLQPYMNDKCAFGEPNNVISLHDETEILWIRQLRDYLYLPKLESQCMWVFQPPKGYGFKIVVAFLETEFVAVTTIGQGSVLLLSSEPFYTNESLVVITYTRKEGSPFNNKLENKNGTYWQEGDNVYDRYTHFYGLITLTKHETNELNYGCNSIQNGNVTTWETYYKNGIGYPNNARCTILTEIKPNQQLFAKFKYLDLETNIDILNVFYNLKFTRIFDDVNILIPGVITFFPFENITQTFAEWHFKSDGSLQKLGFSIDFENIECQCYNEVIFIPCEGDYHYSIMGHESFNYCSNLQCNFTITFSEGCSDKHAEIKIFSKYLDAPNDEYFLVSNDGGIIIDSVNLKVLKEYSENNVRSGLITSGNSATFFFKSGPPNLDRMFVNSLPVGAGYLRLWIKAIETITFLPTITLTTDSPHYYIELHVMNENTARTIELSKELKKQNDKISIYVSSSNFTNSFECITFHNTENLLEVMGNLYTFTFEHAVSFTIYKHIHCPNEMNVITIQAKNAFASNCSLKKNIINLFEHISKASNITMISNSKGSCKMILLCDMSFYGNMLSPELNENHRAFFGITNFWSNSKKSSVKVINGFNGSEIMFKFNRNNAKVWQEILLHTLYYTVNIPPNSSVFLQPFLLLPHMSRYVSKNGVYLQIDKPLESFYQTPFYGFNSVEKLESVYSVNYLVSIYINFTVTHFDISSKGLFTIIGGEVIENLTYVGQSLTFFNTNVKILFYEPQFGHKGAQIHIVAFQNNTIQSNLSINSVTKMITLDPSNIPFSLMSDITNVSTNTEDVDEILMSASCASYNILNIGLIFIFIFFSVKYLP